jgi:hypothetical protein
MTIAVSKRKTKGLQAPHLAPQAPTRHTDRSRETRPLQFQPNSAHHSSGESGLLSNQDLISFVMWQWPADVEGQPVFGPLSKEAAILQLPANNTAGCEGDGGRNESHKGVQDHVLSPRLKPPVWTEASFFQVSHSLSHSLPCPMSSC